MKDIYIMFNFGKRKLLIVVSIFLFTIISLSHLPRMISYGIIDTLPYWKELIFIMIPLLVFCLYKELKLSYKYILMFYAIMFLAIIQYIFLEVSFNVIIYGLIPYSGVLWILMIFQKFKIDKLYYLGYGFSFICIIGFLGILWDLKFETFRYITDPFNYEQRGYSALFGGTIYRPSFLFSGSTIAGIIMSISLGIQLILMELSKNKRKKRIFLTLFLLGALGGIATYTRVALLAITLISIILCYTYFIKMKSSLLKHVIPFPLVVVVVIIIARYSLMMTSDVLIDRFETTFTFKAADDIANVHRFLSWSEGLNDLKDNYLIGKGIGTGQSRLTRYFDVNHYESSLLGIFNEGGLIAIALFLYLVILPTWESIYLYKQRKEPILLYIFGIGFCIFLLSAVNPLHSEAGVFLAIAYFHLLSMRIVNDKKMYKRIDSEYIHSQKMNRRFNRHPIQTSV